MNEPTSKRAKHLRRHLRRATFQTLDTRICLDMAYAVVFGTDWVTRLNEAVEDAGYPALLDRFDDPERTRIETNIVDTLESAFAGWPIAFDDFAATPEGFPGAILTFGKEGTGFWDTRCDLPDVFNQLHGDDEDNVDVFTANFFPFMEGAATHAAREQRVSGALATMAIQGIAHNLGVSPYTSYAYSTIDPASSGGQQNADWMAQMGDDLEDPDDGTGQTLAGTENPQKTFSPLAQALLSYDEVIGYYGPVLDLGEYDSDNYDTAYPVEWSSEMTAGFDLDTTDLSQWFSIVATAGERLSIAFASADDARIDDDGKSGEFDVTIWRWIDNDIDQVAVAHDTGIGPYGIGSETGMITSDPWTINCELPEADDGLYFVQVSTPGAGHEYKMVMMREGTVEQDGVLRIHGAPGNFADSINVTIDGSNTVVTINGRDEVFPTSGISGIEIDSGAGNDSIRLAPAIVVPGVIFAGPGNDRVWGGSGDDEIHLGDGCDIASGGPGADIIRGDGGDDTIDGRGYDEDEGGPRLPKDPGDDLDGGTGRDDVGDDHTPALTVVDNDDPEPCDEYGGPLDIDQVNLSSDGKDLRVSFEAPSLCCGEVSIELWAISTGTEAPALLETVSGVHATLITFDGFYRAVFAPTFTDVGYDYTLTAVIIPPEGSFDTDESNNVAAFGGGMFLAGTVLQIQGTSSADSVSASQSGGTLSVSISGGISQSDSYTLSAITAVHVRTLGSADTLSASSVDKVFQAWGGDGNDSLTGGTLGDLLDGGAGNDWVAGGDGNDTLYGQAGNDSAYGGDGNDTLFGGDDADWLWGGYGADSIEGGLGNDSIVGDDWSENTSLDGADTLHGNDGNDTIYAGYGGDYLYGDDGADTLYAYGGNDYLEGGLGNDAAYGGYGDDTILGGDDDDLLVGGDGADTLEGGNGNDVGYGDAQTVGATSGYGDTLQGGDGADTLYGGYGRDTLDGGAGADSLFGEDDDDSLAGGGDNDLLVGGDGADTLNGDAGNDLLYGDAQQAGATSGYGDTISGGDGNDLAYGGYGNDTIDGGAGADSLFGEEGNDSLTGGTENDLLVGGYGGDSLDGGSGNDTLFGDQQEVGATSGYGDTISGGDGNDLAYGGYGNDTIDGGAGDDSLYGEDDSDSLTGGTENDVLVGGYGGDSLDGGAGNDLLYGDAQQVNAMSGYGDTINGGDGQDTAYGGYGNDTIDGGAGTDSLFGEDDNDSLAGGNDNDLLVGGYGGDTLDGGSGNDTLYGDAQTVGATNGYGDTINGGDGADLAYGGYGNDTIDGGANSDVLFGELGNDTIHGGGNDAGGYGYGDQLHGGYGNDTLYGDSGDDWLWGDEDADTLNGGDGDDLLIGGTGVDTLNGDAGNDTLLGGGDGDTENQ